MTQNRLQAETEVLLRHIPQQAFRFEGIGGPNPYLIAAAVTKSGTVYNIVIMLKDFPSSVPKAFVTKLLRTKRGRPLDSASAEMHTLPSENNCTRICHYGTDSWNPKVSLSKVYLKCLLWLNIYEIHLRTGEDIDKYLGHQL